MDISFEYKQIKEGRKVIAIEFTITRNSKSNPADKIREDPKLSILVSHLTSHGMSETKALKYITTFPLEAIERATKELEIRLKAKKGLNKIENPAGWLCAAIEEGYGTQRTIFQEEEEQNKRQQQLQQAEETRKRENELEITRAYRSYTTEYLTAFVG
jgi:plasmid replication initiation protein